MDKKLNILFNELKGWAKSLVRKTEDVPQYVNEALDKPNEDVPSSNSSGVGIETN